MSVSAKERSALKDSRRIVVKVGTHAIARSTGRPDYPVLRRLVSQISELRKSGFEVIFVSSGAVAAGVEALGLSARPSQVNDVQMCAAVGQARFIYEYEKLFAENSLQIGQVLLTHADFDDSRRAANLRRSLEHLVKAGIIPVVNENDFVADDEIKGVTFGDNDWLASLIAKLVRADALILLTTVDGLLDADGKRVSYIGKVREAMKLVREGQKGKLSKGGMDSKLKAAKNAATAGISVVIANGRKTKVLQGVMSGRDVGSFIPGETI